MVIKANEIWGDGPSGAPINPHKPDVRIWGTWIESIIGAFFSTGGKIYQTRALLNADLTPAANSIAWVMEDTTVANNGIYRKVGGTGTGSWVRAGDLPFSFIVASNGGAGTPNAIQATTSMPVSSSALVVLPIAATNTASPVTVSFNGGAALTIESNTGNSIASGGLLAGMLVFGTIAGSTFRILNDQVSGAIVAAAEAAQLAAEQARDQISAMVPNAFPSTRALLKAIDTTQIKSAYLKESGREGQFFWKTGNFSSQVAADTAEGMFIKANAVATTAGSWVRDTTFLTPQMFGAPFDGSGNDYPASLLAFTIAKLVKMRLHFPWGSYKWNLSGGSALWDPTVIIRGVRWAIPITGDGLGISIINIESAPTLGWQLSTSTDWFDLRLAGLTVSGAVAGPLVVIGKNDFSDPVNMIGVRDCSFENALNDPANEGWRLNYIAGGSCDNVRGNAYANGLGVNIGRGTRARQVEFVNFNAGANGNGDRGIDFTDGFSFGCTFNSNTFENCNFPISNRSANSGAHTFIGSQLTEVVNYEIYSSASLSGKPILVINANANGSPRVDPANLSGVRIIDKAAVATPTAPASGATVVNTTGRDVIVEYWGLTTLTSISIDGFSRGRTATSGEFRVPAGAPCSLSYTGPLTWIWNNAG